MMQSRNIAFFLVPRFSMIALLSALEPLRVVNRFRPDSFHWQFASFDGGPVTASNGIELAAAGPFGTFARLDMAVICSSYDYERMMSRPLINAIRRLAHQGTPLAGLDTGAFFLAEAGVLDGYQATCHWETLPAFRETYGGVDVLDSTYVIDRGRFTASGGASALDMMLEWIGALEGDEMERKVADTLVHSRHRSAPGEARIAAEARYGISDPRLKQVVQAMESHCEDVLRIEDLAEAAGVSQRQLERLFRAEQGCSPVQFYLRLRLERAEQLLTYTRMSVRDVGVACGFSSLAQFSRQFKGQFGLPPSRMREAV
jgi:AraC family carnitine catabolism transcriptional activator